MSSSLLGKSALQRLLRLLRREVVLGLFGPPLGPVPGLGEPGLSGSGPLGGLLVEKWVSLGNDYLVVLASTLPPGVSLPALALRLCHRRLGVGADGLLVVSPSAPVPGSDPALVAEVRVFNPDGSEAEVSGNGVRQAALFLVACGLAPLGSFSLRTLAGLVGVEVLSPSRATLTLPPARVVGEVVHAGLPGLAQWVGNPQVALHAPSLEALRSLDVARLGLLVSSDRAYPSGSNVSVWSEVSPGVVEARVWERGVGVTESSGTGACGAALACFLETGVSPVEVVLPGGVLVVGVGPGLVLSLTGDASRVLFASLPL